MNSTESAVLTAAAPAQAAGGVAPDVSIVVVSWNSARFLERCLESLFAQSGVTVEVIVVDNGSTDGSEQLVRERFPRARLVALGENTGFCAANNSGLARSAGSFVLFANSDTILEESFLREALRPFAKDERIGSVGGKLLRFDGATVDTTGQFLTRSRRAVERGYNRQDGAWSAQEGYVFAICGAALLCRRKMIEDLAPDGELFDASFFAFSEDLDIGWRARSAGWRAWYAPRAVARHYRGGTEESAGWSRWVPALLRRPRLLRYHILKNRWLTLLKNESPGSFLRDLPFIAPRDLLMTAAAVAASPGLILDFASLGPLVRRARAKRRRFLAEAGRWGARRAGAPLAWVGWTDPVERDPDGR
jgi:GT2 family glycosyltransferase